MARGITEFDVHSAADELVAAGERPTVERIRAHLGTGSPNTVTRWLETWWRGLGRRLQAQQIHVDVPAAPEVVTALAGEWWGRALVAARDESAQALATERNALLRDREALSDERTRLETEANALRADLEAARHSEQLAHAQTTELQRVVDQLQLQVQELTQQRAAALARGQELEVAREALQRHLQQAEEFARAERDSLTQHLRAVENRAYIEVDRARQEAKGLSSKLSALDKERTSIERRRRDHLEEARKATAEIQQELAGQRARADGLEVQVENLRSLPLALEAALRKRSPAKPRASGRKPKARRGSGTP